MSASGPAQLRRNGKQQACEPCRKAKLRCDHTRPLCQRCVRRKIEGRCVYHPAPMTQTQTRRASIPSIAANDVVLPEQQCSVIDSALFPAPTRRSNVPDMDESTSTVKLVGGSGHSVGFLGPTSYSAIFLENQLGNIADDHSQDNAVSSHQVLQWPLHPIDDGVDDPRMSSRRICGIKVLTKFPNQNLSQRLLDRYFGMCDVVLPEPVVRHCDESLWDTYGEVLQEPRKPELLSEMSKELCQNAKSPPPSSSSTEEWLESFTGHRFRWEMIGNLLALFGLAIMTLSDFDPIFSGNEDGKTRGRKEYAGELRILSEDCLALSDDIDATNEFVVSLMYYRFTLQSFYEGDTGQPSPTCR